MPRIDLMKAGGWTGGALVNIRPGDTASSVSIDSRTIAAGALFVAIAGDRFDGHQFVAEAFRRGARAALISLPSLILAHPGHRFIVAPDTLIALQDLAAAYRRSFRKLKVVAVTGSNGKTTVKNMIAAAVRKKRKVLKTEGNLNNHIGLPLTLLKLTGREEVAVVELGMNHAGEIARLGQIARPDIGLITNVSAAHIGHFDSIEGVMNAKGELLSALGPKGKAILNQDDKNSAPLIQRHPAARRVTFGKSARATIRITEASMTQRGSWRLALARKGGITRFVVPLLGVHQPENGAAAFTVATLLGISPSTAGKTLARMKPEPLRMAPVRLSNGALLINDAYNANPASVMNGIETAAQLARLRKGKTFLVLGDMEELGKESSLEHFRIGAFAAKQGIRLLVTLGAKAKETARGARSLGAKTLMTRTHEEAAAAMAAVIGPKDVALIKGSRKARMELVADMIRIAEEKKGAN